jgi:hypothetical protein
MAIIEQNQQIFGLTLKRGYRGQFAIMETIIAITKLPQEEVKLERKEERAVTKEA